MTEEQLEQLAIVNYPTGYILKPQTEDYEYLPEYEDLAMRSCEADIAAFMENYES